MGYRGKLQERQRARELRAQAWTLQEIADELDVSKSSVSVWVRDVEFTPKPRRLNRNRGARKVRHKLHRRKLQQIREFDREGRRRVGELGPGAFLAAGVALYWGEGFKTYSCSKTYRTIMGMVRGLSANVPMTFDQPLPFVGRDRD